MGGEKSWRFGRGRGCGGGGRVLRRDSARTVAAVGAAGGDKPGGVVVGRNGRPGCRARAMAASEDVDVDVDDAAAVGDWAGRAARWGCG